MRGAELDGIDAPGPMFEIEDLAFEIDRRTLLRSISTTLQAGRVYGLIGHNGSGKSTLLRLLARQQKPSAGSIRYRGRPLAAWEDRAFAREVSYLPQHPPTATGLSVLELVRLGRYPWHGAFGRFSAIDRAKVEEAMNLTEVAVFSARFVDNLSGGERQRVWLAMLVAQEARCMLLDEPTSALDVAHQLQILGLIRRLAERGPSVLMVLHDINMAARFCDEIIALHSGNLLMRGPPAALMCSEHLQRIYDTPIAVLNRSDGGGPVSFPI